MKVLTGSAVVGTLVALLLIYWMRPLNKGAVALLLVLCIGGATALGGLLFKSSKMEKKGNSK